MKNDFNVKVGNDEEDEYDDQSESSRYESEELGEVEDYKRI